MPSVPLTNAVGAYQPVVKSEAAVWDFSQGPNLFGTGAPSGDPGFPFAGYTDGATGNQYFWNGVTWTAVAVGGSGGSNDVTGAFANPNGNVTPPDPAKTSFYSQDSSAVNNLWRWSVNDQQWYQFVNA